MLSLSNYKICLDRCLHRHYVPISPSLHGRSRQVKRVYNGIKQQCKTSNAAERETKEIKTRACIGVEREDQSDRIGVSIAKQVWVIRLFKMYSRVVSLLVLEGDVGQLIGSGPCTARHHMVCRLLNILIMREEMQLEIEQEAMTSEKKIFRLDLMVQPLVQKGIKIRGASEIERSQSENIQSIVSESMQVHTKTASRIKNTLTETSNRGIATRN